MYLILFLTIIPAFILQTTDIAWGGKVGHRRRLLTAEELELANEARREIVTTLENNLVKFFTLVAVADKETDRNTFGRQDDDDDEPGLNPNTLPQVAQILGAIFAGSLNLTSIVDKSFILLPGVLRTQVEGVFRFLTGGRYGATTTEATTIKAKPVKIKETTKAVKPSTERTVLTSQVPMNETGGADKMKRTYRIKNKGSAKKSDYAVSLEEERLSKLEEEVITAAVEAEPLVRDKEPRFFVGPFRDILTNMDSGRVNLTQIIKFLPDLFQGARQAFTLLENLGDIVEDADDD